MTTAVRSFMASEVVIAAGLVLNAFQSNLVFFYTPTQIANKNGHSAHASVATATATSIPIIHNIDKTDDNPVGGQEPKNHCTGANSDADPNPFPPRACNPNAPPPSA